MYITSIVVSDELKLLAATSTNKDSAYDDKIYIWSLRIFELVKILVGCKVSNNENMSICHEKKILAVGGTDYKIYIYNLDTKANLCLESYATQVI